MIYFFGAEYPEIVNGEPKLVFRAVRPSGSNVLPYVCLDISEAVRTFAIVRHHAHLFKLPEGGSIAEWVYSGGTDRMIAPGRSIKLSHGLLHELHIAASEAAKA